MKMQHSFFSLAAIASLMLVACGDDLPGEVSCTLEARSSVNVNVKDAAGATVSDATVTFAVDGGSATNCELSPDQISYVCGYEIDGQFTITVTKGADTKTQDVTVVKTADGCHVESQTITITLGT